MNQQSGIILVREIRTSKKQSGQRYVEPDNPPSNWSNHTTPRTKQLHLSLPISDEYKLPRHLAFSTRKYNLSLSRLRLL